jgi:hypothetical protein
VEPVSEFDDLSRRFAPPEKPKRDRRIERVTLVAFLTIVVACIVGVIFQYNDAVDNFCSVLIFIAGPVFVIGLVYVGLRGWRRARAMNKTSRLDGPSGNIGKAVIGAEEMWLASSKRTGSFPQTTTGNGYEREPVQDLLRRIAMDLDAGRCPVGLIESARLPEAKKGYRTGPVDLLLDEIRTQNDEAASADPWQPLRVYSWVNNWSKVAWERGVPELNREQVSLLESQGTSLTTSGGAFVRCDLKLADQVVARMQRGGLTLCRADREIVYLERRVEPAQAPPALVDVCVGDIFYRYQSGPRPSRDAWGRKDVYELVDEAAGKVVLWRVGQHYPGYDSGLIVFPDRQWLRFPVMRAEWKGRRAVMTAVDQKGRRLVRYGSLKGRDIIHLNPSRDLDNALLATICLTVSWRGRCLTEGGGGGG